jgi:hypothetical protein
MLPAVSTMIAAMPLMLSSDFGAEQTTAATGRPIDPRFPFADHSRP